MLKRETVEICNCLKGGESVLVKYLSITQRAWHRFISKRLEAYHLGCMDHIFISYLGRRGELTQESLTRFVLMDKATIAKALARLEHMGYVSREVNEKNKREKLVRLTEPGQELYRVIRQAVDDWTEICCGEMDAPTQELFVRLCEQVSQRTAAYVTEGRELD